MSRNFAPLVIAGAVANFMTIAGAGAAEKWPASVVGTWNAVADQTPLTVTIASQTGTGKCLAISGTILDGVNGTTDNLVGSYCQGGGRVTFQRVDPNTNMTGQVYSANVSDKGSTLYMGGSFAQAGAGEYSFIASSTPSGGAK